MNPDSKQVFVSGIDHPFFRIPSLINTFEDTLLAFAEARKSLFDQAENKIVLKRSEDNGETWSACQTIVESSSGSLNNPCCVIDRTSGRIILIFQMYPRGVSEFRNIKPTDIKDFIIYSDNDGKSWSSMREITQSTKYPDSLTIASGPGVGIQLKNNKYKNRIVIPYNHRIGFKWWVYCCYSDDGGQNWKKGTPAKNDGYFSGGNEVQIVELSDGTLMLNCRPWGLRNRFNTYRRIAFSKDGGHSWSQLQKELQLSDSQCQGSIIRYMKNGDESGNYILFSNPATKKGRHSGALYASNDEGKMWPFRKIIESEYFAYSCLANLPDGNIGILYETGKNKLYESINFLKIRVDEIHAFFSTNKI